MIYWQSMIIDCHWLSFVIDQIWLSYVFFLSDWWFQHIWKILVNWDDDIPNIWENKQCSSHHQPDMIFFPGPWGGPSPPDDRRSRPPAVHTGSRAAPLRHQSPLPWKTHGKSMENPWKTHGNTGKPMGNPWEIYGIELSLKPWSYFQKMVMSADLG